MIPTSISIFDLSPSEKLQLVEDLWDDLHPLAFARPSLPLFAEPDAPRSSSRQIITLIDGHRWLARISGHLSIHFHNTGLCDQAVASVQLPLATPLLTWAMKQAVAIAG